MSILTSSRKRPSCHPDRHDPVAGKSQHVTPTQELPLPVFVGGAPALDFLNSIASPVDVPVEWLSSGENFLNWLSQANLIKPDVLQHMRRSAGPGELDAVAVHARALRDWFRSFVTSHMGAKLRPEALRELEPLNRLLARDEVYGQVVSRNVTSDGESISGLAFVADRQLAVPGDSAAASGQGDGGPGDHSRFHPRQGVRVAHLHLAVRRHHRGTNPSLVQHGHMRKSGEAGRASKALASRQQEEAVTQAPIEGQVTTWSTPCTKRR